MTKLQQAEKIAKHYIDMYNMAGSIIYSIECLNSNEQCILDKNQITEYILYFSDKIKQEHLKTFGTKIMEDENER